jgi:hypothetical protein
MFRHATPPFASARQRRRPELGVLLALLLGAGLHCTEEIQIGLSFTGEGSASGNGSVAGGSGTGGTGDLFPVFDAAVGGGDAIVTAEAGACQRAPCRQPEPLACGDCDDNDGDNRVDANDPECLGPCDESESALASDTPVQITGTCATL